MCDFCFVIKKITLNRLGLVNTCQSGTVCTHSTAHWQSSQSSEVRGPTCRRVATCPQTVRQYCTHKFDSLARRSSPCSVATCSTRPVLAHRSGSGLSSISSRKLAAARVERPERSICCANTPRRMTPSLLPLPTWVSGAVTILTLRRSRFHLISRRRPCDRHQSTKVHAPQQQMRTEPTVDPAMAPTTAALSLGRSAYHVRHA